MLPVTSQPATMPARPRESKMVATTLLLLLLPLLRLLLLVPTPKRVHPGTMPTPKPLLLSTNRRVAGSAESMMVADGIATTTTITIWVGVSDEATMATDVVTTTTGPKTTVQEATTTATTTRTLMMGTTTTTITRAETMIHSRIVVLEGAA